MLSTIYSCLHLFSTDGSLERAETPHAAFAVCSGFVCLLALGSAVANAASMEVTACGQAINGKGFLTGDLDCSAFPFSAVFITNKGRKLDLRGYTITAGGDHGVKCLKNCVIYGGGEIKNASGSGVYSMGSVKVVDTTISGNGAYGITAYKRARVLDATIVGNAYHGVDAVSTRVEGSVVNGNGCALWQAGACAAVSDDSRGRGVRGKKHVRVRSSTISDNARGGMAGSRARIQDSTILDNQMDPDRCSTPGICADVASLRRPRLSNTTCRTSSQFLEPSSNWGVCSLD